MQLLKIKNLKLSLLIVSCAITIFSCKKENKEDEFDGSFPGKIKSINGTQYQFKYTEDGLLSEYVSNVGGVFKTSYITWETGQVRCNSGQGYDRVRPRDNAGYALPGTADMNTGVFWSYDALHQVTELDNSQYYWSNGNVDSTVFGGFVAIYEYTNVVDKRDMGAFYLPKLMYVPYDNIRLHNLPSQLLHLDLNRDTLTLLKYTYEYDGSGRVTKQTAHEWKTGTPQYSGEMRFEYY